MTIYEIMFTDGSSYTLGADRVVIDRDNGFFRFEFKDEYNTFLPRGYFNPARLRGYVAKGTPEVDQQIRCSRCRRPVLSYKDLHVCETRGIWGSKIEFLCDECGSYQEHTMQSKGVRSTDE